MTTNKQTQDTVRDSRCILDQHIHPSGQIKAEHKRYGDPKLKFCHFLNLSDNFLFVYITFSCKYVFAKFQIVLKRFSLKNIVIAFGSFASFFTKKKIFIYIKYYEL